MNTCTVTSRSEQKARKLIRNLARGDKNALILATGCYAQVEGDAVGQLGANVVVVPQDKKSSIHDLPDYLSHNSDASLNNVRKTLKEATGQLFRFQVDEYSFHSRAFLKIQDGCDNSCSYCRIPEARGISKSIPASAAVEAGGFLEEQGYREIVLTGVNITAYNGGLPSLISKMLSSTKRVRFRLSSLEPEKIDKDLLDIVKHNRVCPHFHIPVQSGSDRILLSMQRRYRAHNVKIGVERLRQQRPESFIAGDAIVGFPGEEEEDFQKTCELFHAQEFSRVHVFPFSPRPGTTAAVMKGQINEGDKKNRTRRLVDLSTDLSNRYRELWVGRNVEVVVEDELNSTGRSQNYLRVRIEHPPESGLDRGAMVRCRILKSGDPCTAAYLETI